MADENPTDRAQLDPPSPAEEDRKTERVALAFLLNEHPTRLTVSDLALELSGWREDDAVDRAVQELVSAGLLRREGEVIVPTRAALYFQRLEAS